MKILAYSLVSNSLANFVIVFPCEFDQSAGLIKPVVNVCFSFKRWRIYLFFRHFLAELIKCRIKILLIIYFSLRVVRFYTLNLFLFYLIENYSFTYIKIANEFRKFSYISNF